MHKARDLNVKGKNGKMTVSNNENEKTVCINLLCIVFCTMVLYAYVLSFVYWYLVQWCNIHNGSIVRCVQQRVDTNL